MAINKELLDFVKDGLTRGVSRREIEEVLLRSGWDARQVQGALASFADVEFAIPVPRPAPYLDAREAFTYAVLFSTLYLAAFSLGSLVFELIDRTWPDGARPNYLHYSDQAIRWWVSMLIVSFPVFLSVAWWTGRAVKIDPTKRASKVRRGLTYLTLFIASCVLIGDVTTLIYNFLGGELTVRFILKVLTVGVIAGGSFGYYFWDLHVDEKTT